MTVGMVIGLVVLVETLVLMGAVRWLIAGLRSAECGDWPTVMPISTSAVVPNQRETSGIDEAAVAVAS